MNNEERLADRYYESLQTKYEEEATIPAQDYYDLEEKYNELTYQIQDILYYVKINDPAGAYEYAKSVGLV